MRKMQDDSIDTVLTSPFYNTNKKQGKSHTLQNTKSYIGKLSYIRYDTHVDNLTDEEYCDFTEHLFSEFDRILKPNGVVLYNISYGANNTEGMFRAINSIITKTKFTIADVIIWKKKNAVPNNCSRNRLTRICEFVFVFCREDESKSFHCNKRIKSYVQRGMCPLS